MLQETFDIQRRNTIRRLQRSCRVTPATDSYLGDAPGISAGGRRQRRLEPGSGTVLAIEGFVEFGNGAHAGHRCGNGEWRGCASVPPAKDLGTIEKGKVA